MIPARGQFSVSPLDFPRAGIIHTTILPPVCPSQACVFHPFVPAMPVYSTRMPQSRLGAVQVRAQSRPVRSPVLEKRLLVYTTIAKSPRLENLNPYIYDGRASRSSSKPFREDPRRDESCAHCQTRHAQSKCSRSRQHSVRCSAEAESRGGHCAGNPCPPI